MKEYKISKGWAIIIYISSVFMIAISCLVILLPFISSGEEDIGQPLYWTFFIMSIALITLGGFAIIETISSKILIDQNSISLTGSYYTKELMFHEIKGFRNTANYFIVEPIDKNKKRLKISYYFEKTSEIQEWLTANFTDLNFNEAMVEEQIILENEEYGQNKEERLQKLKSAKKVARLLNWIGGMIGLWTLFYPRPYEYAILTSIAFPFIIIVISKYFRGLLKVFDDGHLLYPSIFIALLVPISCMLIRALLDFEIFDFQRLWMLSAIVGSLCTFMFVIANKEFNFPNKIGYFGSIVMSFVFFLGYGSGAIITLNCMYDDSTPEFFGAQVVDKRIRSGKLTTYHLDLTPWGPQKDTEEIKISKAEYNELIKNDTVVVCFYKGLFNISWFEVDSKY